MRRELKRACWKPSLTRDAVNVVDILNVFKIVNDELNGYKNPLPVKSTDV
jgi:hypothetical protein